MKLPGNVIRKLARAGYTSRGVVYLIIGALACFAAVGAAETTNTKGALQHLLSQPFGHALLGALVAGLFGYVVWRLVQAIFDADDHGHSLKALTIRAGLLVSAFTYATLAVYALSRMGVFSSGSSGGGVAQTLSGFLGSGTVAIGLAGIFVGVGGAHCWKAIRMKFEDHLQAREETMRILRPIAVLGLLARGIVFFILAFLLFYRGLSAGDGGGGPPDIEDALRFTQELPMGWLILAVMGGGIVLFAVYSFCEAYWRRVSVV
ncbi:DUF1206 domain-containing protein [Roseibium marinum]|uniref:Uncharacterized protein DUF1206 n=1 Tax=Roseibium marinum TaxID=281252 RepID=A0A2S3UNX5_9HYPH|nr:DUF1206 domain-containing protein [Roseibium marinum]POF29401.1 uncharacterized protein DUF1206 [Roseibium marinum]